MSNVTKPTIVKSTIAKPTVVKAEKASDFLALVPQLVGHQPSDSLVLVGFRGNRTCGAFRFDLPEPAADIVHKRIATSVVGMLCKLRSVDAVVPVIYTHDIFGDSRTIPRERFARRVISRSRSAGFLVRDALCVAADGWASYLDEACPPGGRSIREIEASPIYSRLNAEDRRELIAPRERAALPTVADSERTRVGAEMARISARADHRRDPMDRLAELVTLAECALSWKPDKPPLDDLAALVVALENTTVRDIVMLQFAWGPTAGIAALLECADAFSDDGRMRVDLAGIDTRITNTMAGIGEERPDVDRVEAAIRLLKAVVARAPEPARPAPLCMLAWLNWTMGMSSVAGLFVEEARRIDRDYSFAGLLTSMLDAGHLPEWAFIEPDATIDATRRRGNERLESRP